MLPSIRKEEYLYKIPRFELENKEIKDFEKELKEFHGQYTDCFPRSEPRKHFYNYMVGQLSNLERKSIEPIALAVEGGNVRAMQRLISNCPWDDDKMGIKHRGFVNEDIGSADGALIFDETGVVKKGRESVGVARQYCGNIGKVDNCQVGVFTAYASQRGYALVDKRLFIPEKWFTEDYAQRRKDCGLPQDIKFCTKPRLAAEMLKSIISEKILPVKYILGDTIYGMSPEFIQAAEEVAGTTYLVSVTEDTQCWLKQPLTYIRQYPWKGKMKTKTIVVDGEKEPITLKNLATKINDYFWYRREVSEGAKGPIVYEFTRRRVVLSGDGLPQKTVWLLIRRTLGDNPQYRYFVSNASSSVRLKTLVWLSGMRWAIEQCFEETKSELGLGHYEVRKFRGWHHHMLTCMLAHFFLWHLKIRLGKKSTVHYTVAA